MIAFGGLNWALDGVGGAGRGGAATRAGDGAGRRAADRATARRRPCPGPRNAFPRCHVRLPGRTRRCSSDFDLTIPAGSSLAIVGQNGAGKTTIAKLLCRLYDPQIGRRSRSTASTFASSISTRGASRVTAVFQDFIRFELPLRDNVAPAGAPDEVVRAALDAAGAATLAALDTVLARGYDGGTDLSGGQWQRVALARALCAVELGAGVVLLDEPTAQLDVRGEAEIFDRLLAATRHCTTILISHRFSTVRQADRICVLEHGRVIELGTHDELMALARPLSDDVRSAGAALQRRRGRGGHDL